MLTEERRTIEESYETACNATSLAVKTDERSDADVLIAAGWSDSRLGMSLLRLRSEWESAEKPKRVTNGAIKQMADAHGFGLKRAKEVADHWYSNELSLLLLKLKSLKDVRAQLNLRADRKGISLDAIGPVLLWWLDKTCKACDGHGKTRIPGTPALSSHNCQSCHGSGEARLPYGQEGRKLETMLNDCVQRARASMRSRLKYFH